MGGFSRYAVYVTAEGALGAFGAGWLGWDVARGVAAAQPAVPGLDLAAITQAPRKYGFHATMKAPFRLAQGMSEAQLLAGLEAFCAAEPAVPLPGGLRLARLGGFLALVPAAQPAALAGLESRLVAAMEPWRAPLTAAEIARRRPERLTPRQRALLDRWGYPFVREEFRFHMTLTGDLEGAALGAAETALHAALADVPLERAAIDALSLVGEGAGGRFRLIARVPLAG